MSRYRRKRRFLSHRGPLLPKAGPDARGPGWRADQPLPLLLCLLQACNPCTLSSALLRVPQACEADRHRPAAEQSGSHSQLSARQSQSRQFITPLQPELTSQATGTGPNESLRAGLWLNVPVHPDPAITVGESPLASLPIRSVCLVLNAKSGARRHDHQFFCGFLV